MKKILFGLIGVLFIVSAFADDQCRNLWQVAKQKKANAPDITFTDTGFTGSGNSAFNAYVGENITFPAGTYILSYKRTGGFPYVIFGCSDLTKIRIGGQSNWTNNEGVRGFLGTAKASFLSLYGGSSSVSITIESSVSFRLGFAMGEATVTVSNIQLESGTTKTEFIPYNPLCATCTGIVRACESATGTGTQTPAPTPDAPVEPVFYQQGDIILRKVGNVADSYDATTGKITRRIGIRTLNGTENYTWKTGGYETVSIGGVR